MRQLIDTFKIPMFVHTINIVLTTNVLKSRNKFKDELDGPFYAEEGTVKGLCATNDTTMQVYIFLPPDADTELIAHESFHAICSVYTGIGGELNDGSEEFYAYGLGYICSKVESFMKENKTYFKKKKKDD